MTDPPGLRPRHLVLVGLPGAGKSTIGRAVASTLARDFVDLDTEIERLFGCSVAAIFASQGEAAFRRGEVEVSARVAEATGPMVVAVGGGWIANALAAAHLRGPGRIIYLRVAPEEALQRIARTIARRPMLATGDSAATMRGLYERRRALYEAAADMVVETTGVARDDVVREVVRLVQRAEGVGRSND